MPREISAEELKRKIDSGEDFVLVEALLPKEYEQWHLPGAINIHFNKIAKEAGERLEKDEEIILYCHDPECNASPLAAKKLESLGYTNVVLFPGGKSAWSEANYPVER